MSNLQEKKADYISSLDNSDKLTKMDIIEQNLNAIDFGYEICKKEYEEKLRWIPIEEKLPPLNEYVLFMYSEGEYCVGCLNVYGYYCNPYNPNENDHASIHLLSEVTHWRSFL